MCLKVLKGTYLLKVGSTTLTEATRELLLGTLEVKTRKMQ